MLATSPGKYGTPKEPIHELPKKLQCATLRLCEKGFLYKKNCFSLCFGASVCLRGRVLSFISPRPRRIVQLAPRHACHVPGFALLLDCDLLDRQHRALLPQRSGEARWMGDHVNLSGVVQPRGAHQSESRFGVSMNTCWRVIISMNILLRTPSP